MRRTMMIKRTLAATTMAAALVLGSAGVAGAAHQHVDNPSGCHDTASQAGENSDGRAQWNNNAGSQADENSPVVSSGTC